MTAGKFVFGTQYWRPPSPQREDWAEDLERIRQTGMNTVKFWPMWADLMPAPDTYDFAQLDDLFDLAAAKELKVVANIVVYAAPFWLKRVFPDSAYVNNEGRPLLSQSGIAWTAGVLPGPCFDHDGARAKAEEFIQTVVSRYSDREHLIAWDVWNEINWGGVTDTHPMGRLCCYCEHTVRKFKEWLQRRYGDLDGLSKAWSRKYADWADVEPPPFSEHWAYRTYPDMLDWRRYMTENITEKAEWRARTAKRADPNHPVMMHTGAAVSTGREMEYYCTDDWKIARHVDLYGMSGYGETRGFVAMLDGLRCACDGKEFWLSEMAGGPAYHMVNMYTHAHTHLHVMGATSGAAPTLGPYAERQRGGETGTTPVMSPTPAQQAMIVWQGVARGAKGMLYWQWRPERFGAESPGWGLTRIDGSSTPRVEMATSIAGVLNEYGDMLYAARVPKAEAAILFSLDTYFMDWIDTSSSEHVRNSLLGLYHAMWDSNIPCEFVHEDELDKLKAYKLLFMPYPIYVEQARAAAIREFVDAGGVVVAEALCGSIGDGCWTSRVAPGNGLDEVFCARQDDFGTADEVSITVHEDDEAMPHLQPGDRLTGCRYWETLTPLEGGRAVAAQDGGGPAIVIGSYGKGKTALIGSMTGLSYAEKQHAGTRNMVRGFADWAGVAPPPEVLTSPQSFVETRMLDVEDGKFLFCFNHGEDTEATINLEMEQGRYKTTELLGNARAELEAESGALSLKTQIAGGGVKIFLIRPG